MDGAVEVLKILINNYGIIGFLIGLFGFLTVGILWFVYRITCHFISQSEKRDDRMFQMSNEFSEVVRELTQTIDRDLAIKIDLEKAHQNLVNGMDRMAAQNREEHAEILRHVYRYKILINGGKPHESETFQPGFKGPKTERIHAAMDDDCDEGDFRERNQRAAE